MSLRASRTACPWLLALSWRRWASSPLQSLSPGRQRYGCLLPRGSIWPPPVDSTALVGSGVTSALGLTAACPVFFTDKLTSASRDSLSTHSSPSQSPSSAQGSRRGSGSSVSSVSSVLDEKEDERVRCCTHCKATLLKREQQIDERERTPDIAKLYEVIPGPA